MRPSKICRAARRHFPAGGLAQGPTGGREIHVNRSAHEGLKRLEADAAGLCHKRVQNAADLISLRTLFPDMETGLERLNRDEAVGVRERGAFGLIGAKPYVETGIRHGRDGKNAHEFCRAWLGACLAGTGLAGSRTGNGAGCHRHPLLRSIILQGHSDRDQGRLGASRSRQIYAGRPPRIFAPMRLDELAAPRARTYRPLAASPHRRCRGTSSSAPFASFNVKV
jgi:hypothetical protein